MEAKISVVLPSYNQFNYLKGCLDSIISQNYPNLEIIVFDGGSKDGSIDLLESYRSHISYLKIGGELFIETKAESGRKGVCTYSGSAEKGGSWFAPDELTAGKWFIDAGFKNEDISIFVRSNGRLLAHAVKTSLSGHIEPQGFSRPGSWLENRN